MKRVAFLAVAIISNLTACADQPPSAPEALPAPSARVGLNERQTYPADLFNPCTEELITGEITVHTAASERENNDGSYSVQFHQNIIYQGETATGVKYVASSFANEQFELSPSNGFKDHIVSHFIVNRQGSTTPEDDFHYFQNVDVSYDPATEELTVKRDQFRVECR